MKSSTQNKDIMVTIFLESNVQIVIVRQVKTLDLLRNEVIFTLLFQNINSDKNELDIHCFMF